MSVARNQSRDVSASAESGATLIRGLFLPIILCMATVVAYWNSFAGVFLFDDRLHILGRRRLLTLWPLWDALDRRRPVTDYTLAVNHALGGEVTWGYHLVNLCIHIAAGLTLFGVVRWTLDILTIRRAGSGSSGNVSGGGGSRTEHAGAALGHATLASGHGTRSGGHGTRRGRLIESGSPPTRGDATWLAFVIALLWLVHPLQTQSVTYLVQRGESLMGLFYLLTLYCVIRGTLAGKQPVALVATNGKKSASNVAAPLVGGATAGALVAKMWYILAVIACALGMGAKAVMVTAPVVVLIYDWLFLSRSLTNLVRKRWGLYVGLFATWLVLWSCGVASAVLDPSRLRANVGFGYKGFTPYEYLLTQAGVILQYLKLSVWPVPLCLDYDWAAPSSAMDILPGGIAVTLLLALTLWAVWRHRCYSFAGLWFFIVLAPTSTIVPIKDAIFEHRMYLSLAGVIAVLVGGGYVLLSRLAASLALSPRMRTALIAAPVVLITASLGFATARRNAVYHSESEMWRDVLRTQPRSGRGAENYGTALMAEGRIDEALPALREAALVVPQSAAVQNGIGFCLVFRGKTEEAIPVFQEAIRLKPKFVRAHANLGKALGELGRTSEALEHFREAIRIRPEYNDARLSIGNTLMAQGHREEAMAQYRTILQYDAKNVSAWTNLGTALWSAAQHRAASTRQSIDLEQLEKAAAAFREAIAIDPDALNAHNGLGLSLVLMGNPEEAVHAFRQALAIKPESPEMQANLGRCLIELGDLPGASAHFRAAIALDPRNPTLFYQLAVLLREQGEYDSAAEVLEQVIRLDPGHTGAKKALDSLRERGVGPKP